MTDSDASTPNPLDDLLNLHRRVVLERPAITLAVVGLVLALLASQAVHFRLDASSDSLVLENDEALRRYWNVRERYGSDDYLIVTYTPERGLFEPEVLQDLGTLRDSLRSLDRVARVRSILDVPLLESPPVTLSELDDGAPTLEGPRGDAALARAELLSSPLYSDLLIDDDAQTTALLVEFERDERLAQLRAERAWLRQRRTGEGLSRVERDRLVQVDRELDARLARSQRETEADIASVRAVLEEHRDAAAIHLGGVPMIVADSIDFIRQDLATFGAAVSGFVIALLWVVFRRLCWVALPALTCIAVGAVMVGLLGWLRWPVTIVSSNFLSLLLIITLSLTIHLIVSYRELQARDPEADPRELVEGMIAAKARPCFYTGITTAVAFGSLVVSGIRPVIDFGWMMVLGIAVALVAAFTLFPAALLLLRPPPPAAGRDWIDGPLVSLAGRVRSRSCWILSGFTALTLLSVSGFGFLSVENRFIDYFKESTEIHQGMLLIDRELGGTTPLDVLVDAPASVLDAERATNENPPVPDWVGSGGITASSYWFNTRRLDDIARVHDFLDALPESGKVLSLATAMRMLASVDEEATRDNVLLSVLYEKLPPAIDASLIEPYFSEEAHQLRFAVRVFESDPTLERQKLLDEIRRQLSGELGLADDRVHLTGMLVLYNNLLRSLFRSQILTVGVVFAAIWLTFALVFRSARLATVAIVPNLVAGASVLGLMGWLGVPLDLMTITIAAISIGIGVDDTIHYVHRMKTEAANTGDPWAAVTGSHASVGRALVYTTVTVAAGFSILALSNFVPTIYFGLLTGLAMVTALGADLTLLPLLIVRFRAL